jgi:hypothetical protein
MKYIPQKTIFRINYTPNLSFYDRLYKNVEIAKNFPHWETDKLQVVFKDFEKKHSVTIAFNNSVFESDLFSSKTEEEAISHLISHITNYVDDNTFNKLELRRYYLVKQEMSYKELVKILNLKLFSDSFKSIFHNQITDSTVIIISNIDECTLRLTLGPMQRNEISRFIRPNEQHIDPLPSKRIEDFNIIFKSYPDVSLYLDIALFSEQKIFNQESMKKFWNYSKEKVAEIIDNTVANILGEKIK